MSLVREMFRIAMRVTWFFLAVLPGHVLILLHSRILAARGHPPAVTLLPIGFYRLAGLVATVMILCGINYIVA